MWPWLVQMGAYERAGWYSYDRIDNGGVRSADRVIPELQDLRTGDLMLTSRESGFVVRDIHEGRSIVLVIEHGGSRITSVPMLVILGNGRTRLVFRVKAYFVGWHRLFGAAFDVGDFIFPRKQLKGIKERVEALAPRS